jgi:signal transduction histidine kinase
MQENLEYYLQHATRAQEEERKRIALELHDETIQDLVVLSRQLDVLATKGKELSVENSQLLKELRQETKNIIQSLRNLSQDLRPATLDRLGLLSALENLTSEITKYSGIDMKVSVLGAERRLPEEVELVFFRITQEALRNVARHSKATRSEITLEFGEQKVRISVSDDGKGFSVPEKINDLSQDGKLGLVGMQERARLISGHLSIHSEPGKGTNVTVEALI